MKRPSTISTANTFRALRNGALLLSMFVSQAMRGAETGDSAFQDTNELSLEQLVNIKITSVSKKETSLESSPAAVTVITQDDIRRLGIESIPDALRLVPGMDVAQINSHEWAISIRGFNDQYANDLLVLVDGRAVYTPAFGGVFWDVQDLPMEDIDRIEVIRGPGATLWGANAVNGVVNIITKNSKDTQGTLVSVSGGTWNQPSVTVQYSGQLATNLYYRTYLKYFNRDSFVEPGGGNAPDAWDSVRGGMRLDWEPRTEDQFTLQGDGYDTVLRENVDAISSTAPFYQSSDLLDHETGGNVLGRWTHVISDTSQFSVQAYDDYFSQEQSGDSERQNTFDVDAQHRFELGERNDIVWGLGYRYSYFDFPGSPSIVFNPEIRNDQLFSGFVQDEITLAPDRLHFTVGTKLEHNDYTGFEVEPSARLAWTPSDRQTLWAAVSRAVRTPAIFNLDAQVNDPSPPQPVIVSIKPNPDLKSETLIAYELGYRVEPIQRLSFDVTGFYNAYRDLIVYVPGAFTFPPPVQQETTQNAGSGDTYGTEVSGEWQPFNKWRLVASYSLFESQLQPGSSFPQNTPQQQAQLRSYLDLTPTLEFNGMVSYVDRVTVQTISPVPVAIPSYVRLDLGLVWRPAKSLELGIWGQNLLQARHEEYLGDTTTLQIAVPRAIMAKITVKF
ncbi:MAG TPA: TonB-dependent receptor [Verrucomicrobiae bacterium]|nr:TonB-dependent receptor [Verrucomicrobiae bacterium]